VTVPAICPAAAGAADWAAMMVAVASSASTHPAPAGATRLHVMGDIIAWVRKVLRVPTVLKVLRVLTVLAAVAVVVVLASARQSDLPPIRQRGAWLVIENQTTSPWRDVTVTLNSYYRGVSPTLSARGRLEAPLGSFVTGLGQRFNTAREQVRRVEVRATDDAGNPIALDWDENTGPPLVMEK
jgi:hypothetical protein